MLMPPESDGDADRLEFNCRTSQAVSLGFCFYLICLSPSGGSTLHASDESGQSHGSGDSNAASAAAYLALQQKRARPAKPARANYGINRRDA
jgi:hypothetical protein